MLDPARLAAETVAALRQADFPTVIADYRVRQMPAQVLAFIHDHYLPIGDDIWVPGVRIDRARLAGRPHRVQVAVGGRYRLAWRGGKVRCDGREVMPGAVVTLTAAAHVFEGVGFVEDLTATLVERVPAPPEGAP